MTDTVTIDNFGRDHWSTLLYVEHLCVDSSGYLSKNDSHMRSKHRSRWDNKYSSILKDGTKADNHDDYDCIADLEAIGICAYYGEKITLTDLGWRIAGQLRRNRAEGKPDQQFTPDLNLP